MDGLLDTLRDIARMNDPLEDWQEDDVNER